jgi:hypothetical protein
VLERRFSSWSPRGDDRDTPFEVERDVQGVRSEHSASSSVGSSLSKALESGNFAAARQAMRNAYDQDPANVPKALSAVHGAPARVQAVVMTSTAGLG